MSLKNQKRYDEIYFTEVLENLLDDNKNTNIGKQHKSKVEDYEILIIEPALLVLQSTLDIPTDTNKEISYSKIDREVALNCLTIFYETHPAFFINYLQQNIDDQKAKGLFDFKSSDTINFWQGIASNKPEKGVDIQKLEWLDDLLKVMLGSNLWEEDKNNPKSTEYAINIEDEEELKAEVTAGLEEAKLFAQSLSREDVKSGQWFLTLFQQVQRTYNKNARTEYFQAKYPGLHPDDIADKLTETVVRYATIAGGIAGLAATASQAAIITTAGAATALFVGTIGAEMIYLATIQMRLILDLAVVYDLQLDPEDPEDVMMVFNYALGVAPTEVIGKGIQYAAREGTKTFIRTYINKGTLSTIKRLGQKIGLRIVQGTIIKYAVPVASAGIGSSYNYATTKTIGHIAKSHLKNRGKVNDELRNLLSRKHVYDLIFPAAVLHIVNIDDDPTGKKQELYKAMLTRMSFSEYTKEDFQQIIETEENIVSFLTNIKSLEEKKTLLELLALTAIYDGTITQLELAFLNKVAIKLDQTLEADQLIERAKLYEIKIKPNKITTLRNSVTDSVKSQTSNLIARMKLWRNSQTDQTDQTEVATSPCNGCGHLVLDSFQFCPHCGDPIKKENVCNNCKEEISVDFEFCPHCGSSQQSRK